MKYDGERSDGEPRREGSMSHLSRIDVSANRCPVKGSSLSSVHAIDRSPSLKEKFDDFHVVGSDSPAEKIQCSVWFSGGI